MGQLTIQSLYGQLVPISQVTALLTRETDVGRVADFTKAVEAAKRLDADNQERVNYWGELAIWSTRRLGELLKEGKKDGSIAKKGKPKKGHDAPFTLKEIGVGPDLSKRAQKIATLPAEKITAYVSRQTELGDEVSKAGLLRYAGAGETIATRHGNDVVEWYTPKEYIEACRDVMGDIDLDPATSKTAQKVVKAKLYYTVADDGLSRTWKGNVFLNPPFKMPLVQQFVRKLLEEHSGRNVPQAILLTNNNTDTDWWQAAAREAFAVCFTDGRIKFYNAAGEHSSPTNGQTFCYFGNRAKTFAKRFQDIGLVLGGVS
jgi:phage N-6-adenine-methyltransferase